MKYQPPFKYGVAPATAGIHSDEPNAAYVNGDPATGTEGSIPPAEAFEHHLRELVHLIEYSGQTPDHTDLEQVRKAIQALIGNAVSSASGGGVIAEGSIGAAQLAPTTVVAGTYNNPTFTVDGDGRITAATSGSPGGAYDPLAAIGGLYTFVRITAGTTYNGAVPGVEPRGAAFSVSGSHITNGSTFWQPCGFSIAGGQTFKLIGYSGTFRSDSAVDEYPLGLFVRTA